MAGVCGVIRFGPLFPENDRYRGDVKPVDQGCAGFLRHRKLRRLRIKHADIAVEDQIGVRGHGRPLADKVPVNQALGIPVRHGLDVVPEPLLHVAVFHLIPLHIQRRIRAHHGGVLPVDARAVHQIILDGHAGGSDRQTAVAVIDKGRQHIMHLIIGFRHLQPQLVQQVLPDGVAGIIVVGVVQYGEHPGDVAVIRGHIPRKAGVRVHQRLKVRDVFRNILGKVDDHTVLNGGAASAGVIVHRGEDDVREIVGGSHQHEIGCRGFRIGVGKVEVVSGGLREHLPGQNIAGAVQPHKAQRHRRPDADHRTVVCRERGQIRVCHIVVTVNGLSLWIFNRLRACFGFCGSRRLGSGRLRLRCRFLLRCIGFRRFCRDRGRSFRGFSAAAPCHHAKQHCCRQKHGKKSILFHDKTLLS